MNETTIPEVLTPSASSLRQFAVDQGIPVGARGAIPASVKEAYAKAGKRLQKKYLG